MTTDIAKDSLHSYGDTASRRAQEQAARTTELIAAVRAVPQPISGMGSLMVLALGVWLLVGEFALSVPYTVTGQNTAVRDQGFAVATLLVGMFLRTHRGSKVAVGLLVLLGVLLVVSGIWFPPQAVRESVNEIITGAALVCAALAAIAQRSGEDASHG
jgi:hypothetical protein